MSIEKYNRYDTRTRRIYLAPDATLYARFHELAHKEQHEKMVPAFVAWSIFYRIRLVSYFVTLWIEWDANRRTRLVMERLGLWTDEACKEGEKNLMSYAMRKEIS
jgi:hypothetical protein